MKTSLFLFTALVASSLMASSIISDREAELVQAVIPKSKIDRVEQSEISGWYRAYTGENILYVNPFERKIFFGNLYTMNGEDLTSGLLAQYQSDKKLSKIKDANVTDQLLSAPVVKFGKGNNDYVAAIFTDPFCPYCQKVDSFFKKTDATVYYHYFPLEQLHPGSTNVCKRLYSSKELKSAMEKPLNDAIGGISKEGEKKLETSIALGRKLGIQGTPVVVIINAKSKEIEAVVNANIKVLQKYFGGEK